MADQKCSKLHISTVIPLIMIICMRFFHIKEQGVLIWYFIKFWNLIWWLKSKMAAKKLHSSEFYKVVITLLVLEFFTWDTDLNLLLLSAVYIPSSAQRHNPVWRLRSKMATQNYNIHLLGRYPEISFLPHYAYSCWSTLASCLSQSKFQDCFYYCEINCHVIFNPFLLWRRDSIITFLEC